MVRQVTEHFGRIDILINNAGITTPEPFLKLTTKKWDLVIEVNLKGTFLCSHAVLPHMVEQLERPYYQSVIGFGKDR